MKILLAYPPGQLYQRGEDRSQGNIANSSATSMRAANDLGYASSTLKLRHHITKLVDYQTEGKSLIDICDDIEAFRPDILFFSITNSTIFKDIEIANKLKSKFPDIKIILKGALFYDIPKEALEELDLSSIDVLIGGESDFLLVSVVDAMSAEDGTMSSIPSILYKLNGIWKSTAFDTWEKDLDALPFPDRESMKNDLYYRPDTGAPQATITTSRGCGAKCTYCLTPKISGTSIRYRSPQNIVDEMLECYHKHNITNFFFKSDTFTMNKYWVSELCEKIYKSTLYGKIEWVANSRVNPLEQETLFEMKKAGCWLVAFGFESGSKETLLRIRKGATVEQNMIARTYAKNAGLKCFGFFLVGLPWEDRSHLDDTRQHIFDLDPDFLELHIAVPYYGTKLYDEAKASGVIPISPIGKDYFNSPTAGTIHLEIAQVERFRQNLIFDFHTRPSYITKRLIDGLIKPKVLLNYGKFGYKLLKANFNWPLS